MTFRKRTLQVGVFAVFFGLIAAFFVFASAYRISEVEQAVVVQFGDPVGGVIDEPGLHWKKPFIQEVRRFDKRLLTWDGDVNQIPTLGREFIIVDTTARWRIIDPLLFLKSVRDETGAQSRLDDVLDSVVRDKISNTELEEIVRSKGWSVRPEDVSDVTMQRSDVDIVTETKKGREELTREILAEAQNIMPQYGIELIDLRIKRLNYIEDVRRKVEDRMISERQRIAAQFRSEGEGRSAEIDGETSKMVREILSEAERKSEQIRGEADAEATRIYADAFGKDPEFYGFFKTLESYPNAVKNNTTMMIRADSDFFRYLENIVPEGVDFQGSPPSE